METDDIEPKDFDTSQFHVKLRPYFDIKEDQKLTFAVPEGQNWLWYVPKIAHEDLQDDHKYIISYKIDKKVDFLTFTEELKVFSISEGSTSR